MHSQTEPPEPIPDAAGLRREILLASVGILLVLGLVKHLARVWPPAAEYGFTIAAGLQLYVPVYLIGRRGITREELGLTLVGWRKDLLMVGALSLATIVPFAIGHHYWQTLVGHRTFAFRLPEGVLENMILQLLVVALSEEMFFRGYLQRRMEHLWPAARSIFGVPFGRAIVVSSLVFALAHFVGEYVPARLGPFFPSLVFGLLRTRTGTLLGAVSYHAFCNLLGDVLFASYRST